jgi:uncharacterized protein involved in response to NO
LWNLGLRPFYLLTAVRAWTGQPTPAGTPLMAPAGLWLLGRAQVLTPLGIAAPVVNAESS